MRSFWPCCVGVMRASLTKPPQWKHVRIRFDRTLIVQNFTTATRQHRVRAKFLLRKIAAPRWIRAGRDKRLLVESNYEKRRAFVRSRVCRSIIEPADVRGPLPPPDIFKSGATAAGNFRASAHSRFMHGLNRTEDGERMQSRSLRLP